MGLRVLAQVRAARADWPNSEKPRTSFSTSLRSASPAAARARAQARRGLRYDAEFGEARVRLPQRPEIESGDRHAVNS